MANYAGDQTKVYIMGTDVPNNPGLPTSLGQKTAAGSTSVVPASTTPGVNVAVSIGTSAAVIKAAATRVRLTITNDSANILYIGIDATVTAANDAHKGLAIAANGGAISVPWQTAVYGIYATGSNFVSYIEET